MHLHHDQMHKKHRGKQTVTPTGSWPFWFKVTISPPVWSISTSVHLLEVSRNVSGIFPTAWLEVITDTSPVPERLLLRNLLQLWEGVNLVLAWTTRIQLVKKVIPHHEFEASVRSARGPSIWAHFVWKRWWHKVRKTPLSFSSKVTQSQTFVRLCHQSPVQVHPVLLNPNSVLPLPSHSKAIFKPSSAKLRHWKRRCFGFWTPLLNISHTKQAKQNAHTPGLIPREKINY